MTTPTTDNPYILFLEEPPSWHNNGNTKPWEDHKKEVQTNNALWLAKRTEGGNYRHQHDTPLNIEGSGFPLGLGNRYGPFVYAPLPLDGVVRWGFQREEGLKQFLADLEADTLPKGGATAITPRLTRPTPAPAKAEPEVDPFADLDMGGEAPALLAAAAEADPFADLDMAADPAPSAEPEEDPWGDLDMGGPVTEAVVPEPVSPAPLAPPPPPPVADSVDEEPETDEWGAVIVKTPPAADPADPFADL